jgi:hypothetical protein
VTQLRSKITESAIRVGKRLIVWAIETVIEAVLVGQSLGWLSTPFHAFAFPPVTMHDLFLGAIFVGVMFFVTGYLLTTLIGRLLMGKHLSYPVVAIVLFLIHFEIMSVSMGGAFEPPMRMRVLLFGMLITSVVTAAGSLTLRKWEKSEEVV